MPTPADLPTIREDIEKKIAEYLRDYARTNRGVTLRGMIEALESITEKLRPRLPPEAEVISFEKAKRERDHEPRDSRSWTPQEAVEAALGEIKDGSFNPDMAYLCFRESEADGPALYRWFSAGVTKLELIGLLEKHKHLAL